MATEPFGNWTPEMRADLVALVNTQAADQIEGDPELRAMVDWMIETCGLQPSRENYRLVFMASTVITLAGGA